MYKKCSLESSEMPVLYTGRTVPKGELRFSGKLHHHHQQQ